VAQPAPTNPDRRLDSWKEIATFFGRDERTVRRWEKESALPVHRIPGGAKGRVFAYEGELDQWLSTSQAVGDIARATEEAVAGNAQTNGHPQTRDHAINLPSAAKWLAALALCGVLAGGIFVYGRNHRSAAYASTPRPSGLELSPDSVAVLPFTNVGGKATTDYLSDGITESLIGNLAHLPQLKVRSRDSAFHYKGKDVDLQTIGSNLRVSKLVSGRITVQGDVIDVSAELTDVADNTEIWGHHYSGRRADLISLQQQMAGDIAEKLRSILSRAVRQQVTRQGTENPEAYELYLKGRYEWNKRTLRDIEQAVSYFKQAIAKDPGYALAYSGLADAYCILPDYGGTPTEDFPRSNAAARRALELDPTLARPHAVLGVNEMVYDQDPAGGEAEFEKAFELDPNDATAHQWYSEQLGKAGGFESEALAEANRAHQLDPLSPMIAREVGYAYYLARRYNESIAVCQKLAADEPAFAPAHDCLIYDYWAKSMYPQAIEQMKLYGELSGNPDAAGFASAMESGFRMAGWQGALKKGLEFGLAQRKKEYHSAYGIACLYAGMGDKDQTFRWLDIAYQGRESSLKGLKTEFMLDPVRSDPRFAELLRKVGQSP